MFEILPKTQSDVRAYLRDIAQKHADRSNGFLVVLPVDQDQYPGQSLTDGVIESKHLLSPNEADKFASGVDTRYANLMDTYEEYARSPETEMRIAQVNHVVSAGMNVVNGTDHAELVDIIFNHLCFVNRIRRSQLEKARILDEKPERHAIRGGLVVSKMVDFLGIKIGDSITPVRDLLALGFDKTYLTIPPKNDIGRVEKQAIKTYNNYVRGQVRGDMQPRAFSNRRPMILGVALPGAVNKRSVENPEEIVIGKVSDGVLDFTRNALLVLSAVRMKEQGSSIFIDNMLANIYTKEQLQSHIGRLILGLRELDGRDYVYDEAGVITVNEPRSFRAE